MQGTNQRSKRFLAFWYFLGVALLALGCFFGFVGVKLWLVHKYTQLAISLTIFGLSLAVWGGVVLYRCVRVA